MKPLKDKFIATESTIFNIANDQGSIQDWTTIGETIRDVASITLQCRSILGHSYRRFNMAWSMQVFYGAFS